MRTLTAPEEIADQLRRWREEADLTIDELSLLVLNAAPTLRRHSREYVRRYEKGDFSSERLDVPYLIIVCSILGHDPGELGEDIAQLVDVLRDTLNEVPPPRSGRASASQAPLRSASRSGRGGGRPRAPRGSITCSPEKAA